MNQQTPLDASAARPFDPDAQHPDLARFLAAGDLSDDAVSVFLEATASPLIEPGAATFLWQGQAQSVDVMRWIHSATDRDALANVEGSSLWALRLPVEDAGRFEYKLSIRHDHGESLILDPCNPHRAGDPFGENSVCRTWGYARPEWSEPRGAPAGRIEEFDVTSPTFSETRQEQVYLPAGYTGDGSHPLVVIHDGADYMNYADLIVSLDNLIAQGDIPPLIAVLAQTGDRMGEYPKGRRHARYLVHELLPAVAENYRISPNAADRILLGASLGAVASLATAFRYPGVFGGLVLKSGSFILDPAQLDQRPDPVFQRVARLVQAFQRAPNQPGTRAFVSTGTLEGLAEENRALAEFLRTRDVDVRFKSAWDGHHWHNWRDQLRDGLMWVLRPKDN